MTRIELPDLLPDFVSISFDRALTEEEFFKLSSRNPDLRMELTREGRVRFMPPAGWSGAESSGEAFGQLRNWARETGRGRVADSSAGLRLPDGSTLSPDACFISKLKFAQIPQAERRRFPHIVPDFVIEVRSASDRLADCHTKMGEWMSNGVPLAWLIDPASRSVFVYRAGSEVECVQGATKLAASAPLEEFVMEGFEMDLRKLWDLE